MLARLIGHQRHRHDLDRRLCRPGRPGLEARDPGGDDGRVRPVDTEDGGESADFGYGRGSFRGRGGVVGYALRVPDVVIYVSAVGARGTRRRPGPCLPSALAV